MSKRSTAEQSSREAPRTIWSVQVAVADVPDAGRHIDLVADEPVREEIAKVGGLAALPRLEASFDLTRHGADGLHAVGSVRASVVQTCVVTLEPVESEIDEAIDLVFSSPPAGSAAKVLSIDGDDPPETLHNGTADLGAVATEFLLLGLNPYPRKPGAVFDAPPAGDASNRPFAALAALKKRKGPKDG